MNRPTQDVESILAQAVEIAAPSERQAFVERACGDDLALRGRVERLVANHFEAGSFLERPAGPVDTNGTADWQPAGYAPGTVIGPYKLLEQIGEGGMGLVYVAEQQQPVNRRVALKIIKPGMDSRQVIARFEAERQALAMMEHPHIAKVHDGGTTPEGRPYFVMEFVKGIPITDYCDQYRLTTRQRLELFVNVCHALQHAHQKGIIHRDLKPTNVLVEIHDVRPVVKVIDFGIAKATGQQLTDKTLYTGITQLVGTPPYMSPEQAGLSSLDVDTRSDVYSLGVLLYELLTGTTPFDSDTLKRASYDEMRRIIREDEPPRPSTRMSTIQQARLSTIAEQRRMEPRRLSRQFRGELDWIVMKALEKDRSRRYESVSSLAADVQRFLANDPVLACSPSAGYRLRKFARRNRAVLVTLGLVAAVLLIGTVVSVWQALRAGRAERLAIDRLRVANEQRERAETNLSRSQQALDELYLMVTGQWRLRQDRDINSKQEALGKLIVFYREITQQDVSDPNMLIRKAKTLRRVADLEHRQQGTHSRRFVFGGFGNLAYAEENSPAHQDALAIFQQLAERFPNEPRHRVNLATTYLWMRGEHHCRKAIKIMDEVLAQSRDRDSDASYAEDHYHGGIELDWECGCFGHYRLILADALLGLGTHLLEKGKLAEAEQHLRRAEALLETVAAQYPEVAWHHWALANTRFSLGMVLQALGHCQEAAQVFRRAEPEYRRATELKPQSIHSFAHFLSHLGRYDQAVAECQKMVDKMPGEPEMYEVLGLAYSGMRNWDEAYKAFHKSWELGRENEATHALGMYLANFPDKKFHDPQRALSLAEQLLRDAGPGDYMAWSLLGQAKYRLGDYLGAINALNKALELGHPYKSRHWFLLAMAHHQAGNRQLAREFYQKGADLLRRFRLPGASIPTEYFEEEALGMLGIKEQ